MSSDKCRCNLRTRLVGDGCEHCNPEMMIDILREQIADMRLTDEERDAIDGMVSDYQEIAEFNEERCHPHYAEKARRRAAMLIGLLERLG